MKQKVLSKDCELTEEMAARVASVASNNSKAFNDYPGSVYPLSITLPERLLLAATKVLKSKYRCRPSITPSHYEKHKLLLGLSCGCSQTNPLDENPFIKGVK